MLDVKDINAAYGQVKVLNGVSLNVDAGEILCVMGRNGAGKTTLLKTIMGIVRATSGSITLDDQELTKLENHQIPKMGIGYILSLIHI